MTRTFLLILFINLALSSISQENPRVVKAREGDGIHKLLGRYGLDSAHYVKQFTELNAQKLEKNKWLFAGTTYLLPSDPKTISNLSTPSLSKDNEPVISNFPIFGPLYAATPMNEQTLQGAVFYIVPGHGGPDPGAEGVREGKKMCEDEYAYDIALRLCRELIMKGAKVYMIIRDSTDGIRDVAFLNCDTDEYLYNGATIPRNHVARLRQRAELVNKLYAENRSSSYQRMIEIHIDSRNHGQRVDVYFYHHSKSAKGKKLSEKIQSNFASMYNKHQPDRGYRGNVTARDELYMITKTHPPVVYIELGNIQNDADQLRFILYENRQVLAKWIGEGIVQDFVSEKVK